jgi:uncharacterized protein
MEGKLTADPVAEPPRLPVSMFPYANWGPWRALLGFVAALGAGAVFAGVLSVFGFAAEQLGFEFGFLFVPVVLAASQGAGSLSEAVRRLGLRRPQPSAIKWMAVTVGVYLLFTAVYIGIFGNPHQEDFVTKLGSIPIQVLLIVIVAPISEETCFRGMLFGGLRERLPRIAAALISGLIFGALHAPSGASAVPPLIVFGFLLCLLYEKTGSIVPGIMLHMLNNSVALLGK